MCSALHAVRLRAAAPISLKRKTKLYYIYDGMTISELRLLIRESISEILEEGPRDPAIFKAIFLAGGPGVGKSHVTHRLGLTAMGFKKNDPDVMYQYLMRRDALPMTPDAIGSEQGQQLRSLARDLTDKRTDGGFIDGRLGVFYDGTGKDYDKIAELKDRLEKLGYETCMIVVNADLETALSRNSKRDRTVPPAMVEKFWSAVQKNLGKFQSLFGKNFYIIDNNATTAPTDLEQSITRVHVNVRKWANTPPKSPIAKRWLLDHP